MSVNRKSTVVCSHAAEFALERSLVSLSLVRVVKEKHLGVDAGKWVHVVVQARYQLRVRMGEEFKNRPLLLFTNSLVRE